MQWVRGMEEREDNGGCRASVQRPFAAAATWPSWFRLSCLLCPLQLSLRDPEQAVQLGERFRSLLVPGCAHMPRLSTLLHGLLQLQLQQRGNQRSSEMWRKPVAEYFVTDHLRRGKRADCCLSGAATNALLLLWDCSVTSSESRMPPAIQRGRYRPGVSTKATL